MSDLKDNFQKLIGRQPSDIEIQTLYRVREALDLKNNDALWLVIMVLQYYDTQYGRFPRMIEQAATQILQNAKAAADASMNASAEQAKAGLAESVAKIAREVADNVSRKKMTQWACVCVAVSSIVLVMACRYAFKKGQTQGYAKGYVTAYEKTKDDIAAAAWANTPEGKMAYRLAQVGSIKDLATCSKPGWYIQDKNICIPKNTKNGDLYGWSIPERP